MQYNMRTTTPRKGSIKRRHWNVRLILLSSLSISKRVQGSSHISNNGGTSWHPLLSSSLSNEVMSYEGARLESFQNVLTSNDWSDDYDEFLDSINDSIRAPRTNELHRHDFDFFPQDRRRRHAFQDSSSLDFNDLQLALDIPKSVSIASPPLRSPSTSVPLPLDHQSRMMPKTLKTGTTIVGIHLPHCQTVILGADTRATSGSVVADKRCEKIHALARNVWCCGAGTSGDIDALVQQVRYSTLLSCQIESSIGDDEGLLRKEQQKFSPVTVEEVDIGMNLGYGSIPSICYSIQKQLYKGQGSIGANLVLGGFDPYTRDCTLLAIHPHGSIDVVPYTALGSGGLAAMGTLEANYKSDLSLEEGLELVKDAILAGIKNDLGSGSQVDICILGRGSESGYGGGVQYQRCVVQEETLLELEGQDTIDFDLFQKYSKHDVEDCIVGGVNGFGSLPYIIKSQKVLMENEAHFDRLRKEWLNEIIHG